MSMTDIQQTVSDWPEQERGTLAAWLLDSLPPHDREDGHEEGIKEAARRRDELNSGKVQLLTSDEFWASIERARAEWE
jgi:hypothetical protein